MDEEEGVDNLAVIEIDLRENCCVEPSRAKLGPPELDWTGRESREHYDSVLREPVPDRLLALLDCSLARSTLHSCLHDEILATLPTLRAFAISRMRHRDRADDLVQDTLMRAVANIHRFEARTNRNAWLFTILRNLFHSEYRKRRREVEDADGSYAARLSIPPEQGARLDFEDFRSALAHIPMDQREALLAVGAEGLSYEEAPRCAERL